MRSKCERSVIQFLVGPSHAALEELDDGTHQDDCADQTCERQLLEFVDRGATASHFIHYRRSGGLEGLVDTVPAPRYERDKDEWEGLTATERKNRRRYDGEKAPQPPRLPIFKYVPKALMTVRASNFFSNNPLPHEQLARVLSAFQGLAAEIAGATARNAAYQGVEMNFTATTGTCSGPRSKGYSRG
jgi:hypothetical protein